MHNARNTAARNKMARDRQAPPRHHDSRRDVAAVIERPGLTLPAHAAPPPPPAPFMLQSGSQRFPEDALIPRARGAAIIAVPFPGLTLPQLAPPPEPEPPQPQGRAARRRAAKAAGQPRRKARKAAPASAAARREPSTPRRARAGSEPAGLAAAGAARNDKAEPRPAAPPAPLPPAAPPASHAAAVPAAATDVMPVAASAAAPATAAASAVAGLHSARAAPPQPAGLLPRSRVPVRIDQGLVGRLVTWLGRLTPRKRRAPLPTPPSRLRAVARRGTAPPAPPFSPPHPSPGIAAGPAGEDTLTRRMLLQLSEENTRLRRELEMLRAAATAA